MKRTIEKLAQERRSKEDEFKRHVDELRKSFSEDVPAKKTSGLQKRLEDLEKLIQEFASGADAKRSLFKAPPRDTSQSRFFNELFTALKEIVAMIDDHRCETRTFLASLLNLIEKQNTLTDARDREWDALGSNHVGMIFKSMEWRVDKLAAEYEDVQILMKKFLLLREKLDALIRTLDEHQAPDAHDVRVLREPLEDWKYAGFENRFRGSEEEIRKQQLGYISSFKKGGKVLDLGCGRGEFLELLRDHEIDGEGVDLNGQMIDICLDKGLRCQKGDLLECLAAAGDNTLDGVFSSQVIEHLPLPYLKRLIETAYAKLAPGGVIILETVNPVSVFALVQIYNLDLSHEKPIHPLALQFLLESSGFRAVEVRYSAPLEKERLQDLPGADEKTSLINRNIDRLNELLFAPQNYAVLGIKR